MAKVNISVKANVKGSDTLITFKNTLELLGYMARTNARVLTDRTIVVK